MYVLKELDHPSIVQPGSTITSAERLPLFVSLEVYSSRGQ